jgi:hypothetical protein
VVVVVWVEVVNSKTLTVEVDVEVEVVVSVVTVDVVVDVVVEVVVDEVVVAGERLMAIKDTTPNPKIIASRIPAAAITQNVLMPLSFPVSGVPPNLAM